MVSREGFAKIYFYMCSKTLSGSKLKLKVSEQFRKTLHVECLTKSLNDGPTAILQCGLGGVNQKSGGWTTGVCWHDRQDDSLSFLREFFPF